MNKKNKTTKNMGLMDKSYEEISFACINIEDANEYDYNDAPVNFFGVRSGLSYKNLDVTTLERF